MRILAYFVILLLLLFSCNPEEKKPLKDAEFFQHVFSKVLDTDTLLEATQEGKWGMIDTNGEVKVPFTLEEVYPSSKDAFRIRKNGKIGMVNQKGDIILDFEYSGSGPFSEGISSFKINGSYFSITKRGRFLSNKKYRDIGIFSQGRAWVEGVNSSGYGFIDTTGSELIPINSYYYVQSYSEGWAFVRETKNGDNYFIDLEGNRALEVPYKWCGEFREGLCPCEKIYKDTYGRVKKSQGFIDKEGRVVIPFEYDRLFDFNNGLAIAWYYEGGNVDNHKYFVLNRNGEKMFDTLEMTDVFDFNHGMTSFEKDGKWGVIDTLGNIIVPPTYSYTAVDNPDFPFIKLYSKDQSSWGYANRYGKIIWKPEGVEF